METDAVGYIRVSRADENPENQAYVIRKYCKEHNIKCFIFAPEIEVSRLENPFERPVFKQLLRFMELNNINTLIVESIDRLTAEPKHYEEIIRYFTERGWKIIFVRDADISKAFNGLIKMLNSLKQVVDSETLRETINYQIKTVKDFMELYWRIKVAVAKDYVLDVSAKTRRALARLKEEGKVYTKPTLVHYYALYLARKSLFKELTPEEIQVAKNIFYEKYVKPYLYGVPIRRLWRKFLREEQRFIEYLDEMASKRAARGRNPTQNRFVSYPAFYNNLKRLLKEMKEKK
ncbi:MAG: recombinase family protein [Crenarchaeota archaeon]|nr:recombinase family protein [Thermoproteota archaeon]